MNIKTHYDLLIEENNDPFRDPPSLRQHMESWDGQVFLDLLELAPSKMVLEIGIGTEWCLRSVLGREGLQKKQPGAVVI